MFYTQSELDKRNTIIQSQRQFWSSLDASMVNNLLHLFDKETEYPNHKITKYIENERIWLGLDSSNISISSGIYGSKKSDPTLYVCIKKYNKDFLHLIIHLAPRTLDPKYNAPIYFAKSIYNIKANKHNKKSLYTLISMIKPEKKPDSLVFSIADEYTISGLKNADNYDTEIQQEMNIIIRVLNKMFDEYNYKFYIGYQNKRFSVNHKNTTDEHITSLPECVTLDNLDSIPECETPYNIDSIPKCETPNNIDSIPKCDSPDNIESVPKCDSPDNKGSLNSISTMGKHMYQKRYGWESIVEEADDLFDDLIHKYENKFDGEEKIKHFDVGAGWYSLFDEASEIKEKYNDEIQRELVPWIKNEFQNNELFKIENWKPFRNRYEYVFMYLGYRKLFQYKHYIFQLALLSDCELDECKYCEKKEYGFHFGLEICGWKERNHVELHPVNIITILDDNIVPKSFWDEKE